MKKGVTKLFVLPAMVCALGLGGCAGLSNEDRDLMNSAVKASEDCKAASVSAKKAEDAAIAAQSAANKAADAAARAEAAAAKMERIFEKSLKK